MSRREDMRSSAPRRTLVGIAVFAMVVSTAVGAVFAPSASAQTTWSIIGAGWGHGVGMSQWGARGMASQGYSAAQILGHYYQGTAVTSRGVANDLRVLVAEKTNATLTSGGTTTFGGVGSVGPGATVTVSRWGNQIALNGAVSAVVNAPLTVSYNAPLRISPPGNRYVRGTLTVNLDPAGGLRFIIGGLTMDAYLYGLGEVPSSWPTEALRAQAIAGRSFAQNIAARANRWSSDFDLYASVVHQAYIGYEKEDPAKGGAPWVAAVQSTSGQVVTHNGSVIATYYSASSGGHTENSEKVWSAALPYLRGVADPWDELGGNPHTLWGVQFSAAELGAKLGLGPVTSVNVGTGAGVSGRLDKVSITFNASNGSRTLTGAKVRTTLGLKSTKFVILGASNSMPTGSIQSAFAQGRTLIVAGRAVDPGGAPMIVASSTANGRATSRGALPTAQGNYLIALPVEPGNHKVCVTLYDNPTRAAVGLGCRNVTVK